MGRPSDAGTPGQPDSELDRARKAHLSHFVSLIQRDGRWLNGDPEGKGSRQVSSIKQLTVERENLLEALGCTLGSPMNGDLLKLLPNLQQLLLMTGQLPVLRKISEEALNVANDIRSEPLQLYSLAGLSAACQGMSSSEECLKYSEACLALLRRTEHPAMESAVLRYAGLAQKALGALIKSEEYLQRSAEVASRANLHANLCLAQCQIGTLAFERADFHSSEVAFESAMESQAKAGNLGVSEIALYCRAMLDLREGRLDSAERLMSRVMALAQSIGDQRQMAHAACGMGNIASQRHQFHVAKQHYERSLAILREIGNRLGEAAILCNLGVTAIELGDLDVATQYLDEQLALETEIGHTAGALVAMRDLALVRLLRGDTHLAALVLQRALHSAVQLQGIRELVLVLGVLGLLCRKLGKNTEALALLSLVRARSDELALASEPYLLDRILAELAGLGQDSSPAMALKSVEDLAGLGIQILASLEPPPTGDGVLSSVGEEAG